MNLFGQSNRRSDNEERWKGGVRRLGSTHQRQPQAEHTKFTRYATTLNPKAGLALQR